MNRLRVIVIAGAIAAMQVASHSQGRPVPAVVDDAALRNADARTADWITHGRTYGEQRFSPLAQINDGNVSQLGLAWSFQTDFSRGHEATPIVVGGVIYTTSAWSGVYALDARDGRLLWKWDPQVSAERGGLACCDVVNRGPAFYNGRVYVGALDGRLVALDAVTGRVVWETLTIDLQDRYTVTGAPRIVKGKVIIGNAGAEYGVRGYVSAYDAETGALAWRFYTVPGDPARGFESPALERAAKTWTGQWWTGGGGGTVWDALAYDPDLDLLYVGTGNGSPWNRKWRSPGGGDNLYLSSILALRPDTGEYVWHYQTTPGDSWDYTATQHIMLADLTIGGRQRHVLMQAPKNGFFYVLDRATGELISAEKYAEVTWASHVDRATGRPVELPNARYDTPNIIKPGPAGAHNWHPMSFNPQTGLVYIPVIEMAFRYEHDPAYRNQPGPVWNLGTLGGLGPIQPGAWGALVAWDPVAQKPRWTVKHPTSRNSGTLTTAGNLVFQGTGEGRLVAYRADTGVTLWESAPASPLNAGPVTFLVDGVQHVAIMAGPRGGIRPDAGQTANGSLLVFKLGGSRSDTGSSAPVRPALPAIAVTATPAQVAAGAAVYGANCAQCHGPDAASQNAIPDLRLSAPAVYGQYADILLNGSRAARGMPSFAGRRTAADVDAIRGYVLTRRAAAGSN